MTQVQHSADAGVAATAGGQQGLITRRQIYRAGLDAAAIRRRLRTGRLVEVLPNVYMIGGAQGGREQEIMAHILWAGLDDTLASHRCAGDLLRLDGMRDAPIEIVTTRKLRPISDVIIHRVREIKPVDRWTIGGIPTTHPARTALDLAGVLEWEAAEEALEEMLLRDFLALARLRWQSETAGGRGVGGSAHVGRFLADRPRGYVPLKSPLELRVRRVLRAARIPEPLYEHPVRLSTGWTVHPDFSWPDRVTTVEVESYRWHGGRVVWERDIERYEALRRDGWTVIRITAKMLHEQRTTFIADVRDALR
ncbi:MAG: type IV toxin-antitoxin system AbiEi family antitoxin domain-containing protein [Actinomycetota bacterium]